jgi:hypothetical protein
MKQALFVTVTTATLGVLLTIDAIRADVIYSTSIFYAASNNLAIPGGTTGGVSGDNYASLSESLPGDLGGFYEVSGAATAAIGELGVAATLTLTDYVVGSYVGISTPGNNYVPNAVSARAQVDDTVTIVGPEANYNLQFTYTLSGDATTSGTSNFQSWVVPNVVFTRDVYYSRVYDVVIPEDGSHFSTVTVTAQNVPSNVELNLAQYLELILIAQDSHYEADDDPYVTGEFKPDEWPFIADMPDPYSLTMNADFADTLVLDTIALLDTNGNLAFGRIVSQNGVTYPVDSLVPEPTTALMFAACWTSLLTTSIARRRTKFVRTIA